MVLNYRCIKHYFTVELFVVQVAASYTDSVKKALLHI